MAALEGQPAPDFSLPDQSGAMVSLAALRGRPFVLFFYPRASTPGCTIEAREFRDAWPRFRQHGVAVIGASPDTMAAQKKFCDNQSLPFPLLADRARTLANAYDVVRAKTLYGRLVNAIARTTFLIDDAGVLRRRIDNVKPRGHAEQVFAALGDLGLLR